MFTYRTVKVGAMAIEHEPQAIAPSRLERLEAAIRRHCDEEQASWDDRVEGDEATSDDLGLWDGMPCIDSKDVARMAPIFEEHLDVPFDVKHIRAGGYSDIEDVLADLVPKLTGAELPATFTAISNGGSHDDQSAS